MINYYLMKHPMKCASARIVKLVSYTVGFQRKFDLAVQCVLEISWFNLTP